MAIVDKTSMFSLLRKRDEVFIRAVPTANP